MEHSLRSPLARCPMDYERPADSALEERWGFWSASRWHLQIERSRYAVLIHQAEHLVASPPRLADRIPVPADMSRGQPPTGLAIDENAQADDDADRIVEFVFRRRSDVLKQQGAQFSALVQMLAADELVITKILSPIA